MIPSSTPARPWYHWRRLGFNFLALSILGHLFFGLGATYLIVQTFQGERPQNFTAPASGPNAPTRVLEHKVQMQKKQQSMSAPAAVKRVQTTSSAKVTLPTLPTLPRLDSQIVPLAMAGMGGTGVGLGTGFGTGGNGTGTGVGLSLFGARTMGSGGLVGTFFDFKQTPQGAANGMDQSKFQGLMKNYVLGGMNDSAMGAYFKGPTVLYLTQLCVPRMASEAGVHAFNLDDKVEAKMWCIHYKGRVKAPVDGRFRFVGVCDDILVVRFNNQVVLDCGSFFPTGHKPERFFKYDTFTQSDADEWFKGCGEGIEFGVTAGTIYPIDILIAEDPGGSFRAYLTLEQKGVEYQTDSKGNPILPLFRVADGKLPQGGSEVPPLAEGGPIWQTVNTTTPDVPPISNH